MKKFPPKNFFPGIGLGIAVGLGVAAVILGDRLTAPISGLCFGLAGALGGLSGSRLLMAHFDRTWTPEERKEIERAERDERNVSIREKAARWMECGRQMHDWCFLWRELWKIP